MNMEYDESLDSTNTAETQDIGVEDPPRDVKLFMELAKLDKELDDARLEKLTKYISDCRTAAVEGRRATGVETRMQEDLAFYNGEDELAEVGAAFTKSRSLNGGISENSRGVSQHDCTDFFNITRPFVDAATARMGDILLPAGDWNFKISATPTPDIELHKTSNQPVVMESGEPVLDPQTNRQLTVSDFMREEIIAADLKIKRAELRIRDHLIQTYFHEESRKVIEDAGKLGIGILKGPMPKQIKTVAKSENGAIRIEYKEAPCSERVDPFNFFPDPTCGGNIKDASYVIERDSLTARTLQELRDDTGYIARNIDKVLDEGPNKANYDKDGIRLLNKNTKDSDRFDVWYYVGDIRLSDLKAVDVNVRRVEAKPSDDMYVSATIMLVNDTIIKGYLNPFGKAGDIPYDVFAWQRVPDSIWGAGGVARQGRVAQKMLLAACRALMENMALSSGPMVAINRSALIPANGSWRLHRNKIFYTRENADIRSVADAITAMNVPSQQAELTGIIQLALKHMEDSTGVTFLLQGQQGAAPDTVGGMQLVHQNATAFLRRTARLYDESITEPHIRRYYEYHLVKGDFSEIGDVRIEAIGSSALVDREVQLLQMQQIMQMAVDPTFGLSKKKVALEMLRLWKYDPYKFAMDAQELQDLANQTPPPDPTIEAARIRTEGELQVAQIKTEAQLEKIAKDTDRDLLYAKGVEQRNQMTNSLRIQELQLKRDLAILQYANDKNMQLDDIKAKLATEGMRLQVQKELSAINKEADSINPPTEPAGRATPGKSFSE